MLLIAAIGASFFLQYTVKGIVGTGVFAYPVPSFLSQPVGLPIADALRLKWLDVVVVGSAILMMLVLYLFVMRSKLGTAIRAVSEDAPTAALMGINVDRAIVTTFAIGAAMAGAQASCSAWCSARSTISAASSQASRRSPPPSWVASATSRAP